MWNNANRARWLLISNRVCSRMFARSFLELLRVSDSWSKWRFSSSLSGYTGPPSFCWLLSLEWLTHFEHIRPISFKQISFWCPFLDPHLTTHQSNIGVHMLEVLDLHPSTLVSTLAPDAGVEIIYFCGSCYWCRQRYTTNRSRLCYRIQGQVHRRLPFPSNIPGTDSTLFSPHFRGLLNQPRRGMRSLEYTT